VIILPYSSELGLLDGGIYLEIVTCADLAALQAGKSLCNEKPLTINREDRQRIVSLALLNLAVYLCW
jgi:hypothetical protein